MGEPKKAVTWSRMAKKKRVMKVRTSVMLPRATVSNKSTRRECKFHQFRKLTTLSFPMPQKMDL